MNTPCHTLGDTIGSILVIIAREQREVPEEKAEYYVRLVPSAAAVVETESGKRMLFKEEPPQQEDAKLSALDAKLVAYSKNNCGKEGTWFQWNACLLNAGLLLGAENARCTLRLGVEAPSLGSSPIGMLDSPIKVSSLKFV